MSRRSLRTTALAAAVAVTCAGTAAWSAPPPPVAVRPRPGPALNTHLDYGRYVVSVDPSAVQPEEEPSPAGPGRSASAAVLPGGLARP